MKNGKCGKPSWETFRCRFLFELSKHIQNYLFSERVSVHFQKQISSTETSKLFVKSIFGDLMGELISNIRELKIGSYDQQKSCESSILNFVDKMTSTPNAPRLCIRQEILWHHEKANFHFTKILLQVYRLSWASRSFSHFPPSVSKTNSIKVSSNKNTPVLYLPLHDFWARKLFASINTGGFNEVQLTELWSFNWWQHLA